MKCNKMVKMELNGTEWKGIEQNRLKRNGSNGTKRNKPAQKEQKGPNDLGSMLIHMYQLGLHVPPHIF